MTNNDDEFNQVMRRAVGVANFIGTGKKVPASIEFSLVELQMLCVRNRDLRAPKFLAHPAHLPEGNELRFLMAGEIPKDNILRSDARDWAGINKREAARAAAGLRSAITAIRTADILLNDPDNDEVLHEWMLEIDAYVRAEFKTDPREAPVDVGALDAWCVKVCEQTNPTPEWLRDFRRGRPEFDESNAGKIAGAATPHTPAARSLARRYGEDDE